MADSNTTNHSLTQPDIGSETGDDTENWGTEWNNNASVIDGKLAIVDTAANQSNYSPKVDQLYYASDTEVWYRGDGTNWVQQETTGPNPTLDTPTIGSLGSALDLNTNDLTDGGTPVYDASAGVVPANRLDTSKVAANTRTVMVDVSGTVSGDYLKVAQLSDNSGSAIGDCVVTLQNAIDTSPIANRTVTLQFRSDTSQYSIDHWVDGTSSDGTQSYADLVVTETAGTSSAGNNEYHLYVDTAADTDSLCTVTHATEFGSVDYTGTITTTLTGSVIYDTGSDGPSTTLRTGSLNTTTGTVSDTLDVFNSLSVGNYGSINGSQIVTQATQTITPTTTKTAAYTADNRDCVLCDASGGAFTVTLPSVATDVYTTVKKIDSSTNAVTVASPNTETIDGASSVSLASQYDSVTVTSDGTNYFEV